MHIAVSIRTKRPSMWRNVCENVLRQTRVPDLVCIAYDEYMPVPTFPPGNISLVLWPASSSYHYGRSHNENMQLIVGPCPDGFVCNMDDDDYYGANYLASVEQAALAHPDAWILGKAECWVRWIGGRRDGDGEWSSGHVASDDSCTGVAGMTICVNVAQWLAHPTWRFQETLDDDVQLQVQAQALGGRIYQHAGVFTAQRYGDPSHAHSWNNPRDHW